MKFRLTHGMHDQGDGRVYKRGDVVVSDQELDKRFGYNRFQRLDDQAALAPPPANESVDDVFSDMTVAELKKFAEEEEIDLDGATKKDVILAVIRRAMSQS